MKNSMLNDNEKYFAFEIRIKKKGEKQCSIIRQYNIYYE